MYPYTASPAMAVTLATMMRDEQIAEAAHRTRARQVQQAQRSARRRDTTVSRARRRPVVAATGAIATLTMVAAFVASGSTGRDDLSRTPSGEQADAMRLAPSKVFP